MNKQKSEAIGLSEAQIKNYEYFRGVLPDLLKDFAYLGKYVVVSGEAVRAVHDEASTAYRRAMTAFEPGEFIIQQVIDENQIFNVVWA